MNSTPSPAMMILIVCAIVLILFVSLLAWASRYRRVGPNEALIVSGRRIRLADGSESGFRVVKGGGTFVLPVIEKAEVLSLGAFPVELVRFRARAADGMGVELDCSTQLKVKGDDASIASAAEYFLGKSENEMKKVIGPVLEKVLSAVMSGAAFKRVEQDPAAYAAKVETEAMGPLAQMGLATVSVKIQSVRAD